MLLSEAFEQFEQAELRQQGMSDKTVQNYRTVCNSLVKCLGDFPVSLFTEQHAIQWRMYREQRGSQPSTISHDLCRLKSVLKYLRKTGHNVLDEEHIKKPKIQQKAYTWLDYSEIQQILDVINSPRDKAIVACLFATGCRISELLNLNRDDLKGNQAEIIGKGSKLGTVYFDDYSMNLLDEYLSTRKDSLRPLFVSSQRRRITASRVSQLIHEYADLAGLDKNVTPHVFRHSFATDLRKNGADIFDIKEQLRHKRISTTQIYTHINDEQRKEAYNKFHSST